MSYERSCKRSGSRQETNFARQTNRVFRLRFGKNRHVVVFGLVYALFTWSKPTVTIPRRGSPSILIHLQRHPTQRPLILSCPKIMAAVVVRRPLAPRAQQGQVPNIVSPATAKVHNSSYAPKRARSPDTRHIQATAGEAQVAKRARCTTVMTAATTKMREQEAREKERRRAEREAQKEEFRIKYTKAFPSWVFYFDTTDSEGEELAGRVMQLNAVCGRVSAR